MVRPRVRVSQIPQEPNLANVVATLQRQLLEQQQETNRLREQIAHMNQVPRDNEVPPQDIPIPPVAPQAPGIRQEAPEFEGLTNPIEADNWLIDIQDARHWWMIVQMRRDVAAMSWQDFVADFRMMYYNREILAAQQDEFNSMKQGSITVMEAVKRFEQLARLCPELIPNETQKVRRMMKMFRTNITMQVSAGSSPPTLVSDCISRAIRAEYWINQDKKARAQGPTSNLAQGSKQSGRNKRKGNATGQGQQRNFPQKRNNRGNEGNINDYQLHAVQAKIEGPSITPVCYEAPEPQVRIYAYTKGDAEAGTSHVVTGQISIPTYDAIVLFDSGVTHSFISMELPRI
ncbi:hypothetical protein TIFTF001_040877 [Ficus carica]|uniref:Retrotransposon gag domain-containing protein n=1 Tax=Ficus carica TaxID=3494 RepID=A0AA87ZFE1_FICCA|nr:hypothetical protein TIFTF001_040864 [Ficus carica]GMN26536.1 hypothetical protein TIFTF001_040868 [Ficus carica]GMN26569.1 hypothetical protein TIFTF001_040873 [Ficus carica]GMN26588.1 hypothetical protein TIFTF001_040877 [Ficus carica]